MGTSDMRCIFSCFVYKYEILSLNTAFLLMSNLEEVNTQILNTDSVVAVFRFVEQSFYMKVPLFCTNSLHSLVGAFGV
jgi:hypothetical protein